MAIDPSSPMSFRTSDDLALVQRIIDRRQEALGELYDRYSPLVLAVTRRILESPSQAEEALLETFFQVWNQAERFDSGGSSVSTWLVLLARGRALERLRQRRSRVKSAEAPQAEPGLDATVHNELAEVAERRERVRRALGALSAEQREVLDLAFFEGLSLAEISERARTPLATVKTRALHAMKRLRRELRAEIRELM
jgi:RNA polymerase sigma-70 factor (ECF subfamily)